MISSWSFSRLTVFEQCKFRAKLQMVDKIPDPTPHPAADRGTEIHQTCEDYVRGTAELRKEMRHFEEEFVVLRDLFKKGKVSLEGEWGFTRDWEPCDYKKAWLRAKADAVVWLSPTHVVVIDYKTGKRFGNEVKHGEQLQLYALCMMVRHPEIERVTVELWYLDQNEMAPLDLNRKMCMRYLKLFDIRGHKMTSCTEFPPNPNIFTCKWCPYGPRGTRHCMKGV